MIFHYITIYLRTDNLWNSLNNLIAPIYIQNPQILLFVMSNSVGITQQLIAKALNLLNNEDNNIVIAASPSGKVVLWGINYYDEKIFAELDSYDFTYDNFLKVIGKSDNFLFTIFGLLTVENLDDFKSVYKVLSTKESIEFCSHEKHELFTQLFIEYKELL